MATLATLQNMMDLYARTNATDYVNNRTTWLNAGIRNICLIEPWWFTRTDETQPTVSGTPYITLSADIVKITGVWIGAKELREFDMGSRPLLGTAEAEPTHYRKGDQTRRVELAPTPNGVYNVRVFYHRILADLVDPTDSNGLTDINPYACVFAAMIEAAQHLGRDPSIWKVRLEEELDKLRAHNARIERSAG